MFVWRAAAVFHGIERASGLHVPDDCASGLRLGREGV